MAVRRSTLRQCTNDTAGAAERWLARQRPAAREVLDEESERRRKRRALAAAAAARAGGVLSLTAVLLGTPSLALTAPAAPTAPSVTAPARAADDARGVAVTPYPAQ
jgi:hypothetical protein